LIASSRGPSLVSKENQESLEIYRDWGQVAGYLDGDGCVDFDSGKRVLHPKVLFTDNYLPMIEMLRLFLTSQGIRTWKSSYRLGAWRIGVAQADSVLRLGTKALPYCSKKRLEVKAVVDYLENRITGTEFVQVFNESVKVGNRTGKIRVVDIPYTRKEGQILSRKEHADYARRMGEANQILTDNQLEEIRVCYISGEATNGELAKKYGVNPATISRAVFGRNPRI